MITKCFNKHSFHPKAAKYENEKSCWFTFVSPARLIRFKDRVIFQKFNLMGHVNLLFE